MQKLGSGNKLEMSFPLWYSPMIQKIISAFWHRPHRTLKVCQRKKIQSRHALKTNRKPWVNYKLVKSLFSGRLLSTSNTIRPVDRNQKQRSKLASGTWFDANPRWTLIQENELIINWRCHFCSRLSRNRDTYALIKLRFHCEVHCSQWLIKLWRILFKTKLFSWHQIVRTTRVSNNKLNNVNLHFRVMHLNGLTILLRCLEFSIIHIHSNRYPS